MRAQQLAALVAAAVAGALAAGCVAASQQPAGAAATVLRCPVTGAGPYVSCVRSPDSSRPNVGQQITDGAGSDPGTPWQVTDHTGAPMAWVNLFGLYSGGDGWKMPGGLICVTYGTAATVACLTPKGDLQLTPAGPTGPTGPSETLTPADIAWIHAQERAGR